MATSEEITPTLHDAMVAAGYGPFQTAMNQVISAVNFLHQESVAPGGGLLKADGSVDSTGDQDFTAGLTSTHVTLSGANPYIADTGGFKVLDIIAATNGIKIGDVAGAANSNVLTILDSINTFSIAAAATFSISAVDTNITGTLTPVGRTNFPMGETSYFDLTGLTVTIDTQSDGETNMVDVEAGTLSGGVYEFDDNGSSSGHIRYTGAETKMFHVACSVSFSGAANDRLVIGVAKNGDVISESRMLRKIGAGGDVGSTAMHIMVSMAQNDYLTMQVGNTTDTSDVTVNALNLFAMGV